MATVNKDFKIKSGLVVEGTTGTINGFDILTKKTADQNYIIGLIGGAATSANEADTVVLRDENGSFSAEVITADGGFVGNVTGTVSDISNHDTGDLSEGSNLYFTNQRALDATSAAYDAAGAASTAQANAEDYTDTALESYTPTASLDAAIDGYGYLKSADLSGYATETYADNAAAGALEDAQTYADALINDSSNSSTQVWSAYKTNTEIGLAQSNAETYADNKIDDNSTATDKTWSAYKIDAEISAAQSAAEQHADDAVAALVDSAPAMLDTLNELAAALQDNPDVITDLQNVAAGKQDTLTAGSNIDITGATISVTGLDSEDISDFNTAALSATSAAYDAAGSASAAQTAAQSYADGLASNYDAAGSASAAQTAAETFATNAINALDTDDIEEGTSNLYFTNQRAIDAVGGTIGDAIDELTTDDIEEGLANQYFTDSRAKDSAAALLTGANLVNITIDGTGAGLTITAENGVADSDTDDLTEGSNNLYFTDERAVDALNGTTPNFEAVELGEISKNVAGTTVVPVAGIATAYSWLKDNYRSAEFLVKVAYGDHTEISKVLLTLDVNDNIAITEYGIVGTNGSASTVSAAISGNDVQLQVTTVNNTSTVTVVGTLLA